jgi:hypothetical protein
MTIAPVFPVCAAFLQGLGIPVTVVRGVSGFLNHVRIDKGGLLVDPISDEVCGSMLHEAGHIAVMPSLFRPLMTDDAGNTAVQDAMDAYVDDHPLGIHDDPITRGILQSGETEAIAWSYAAAAHLAIDTRLPFMLGFQGMGWKFIPC